MAPSRGRQLLISVFAPEGWPKSVAPEYGRYQLWDTIQQVTFFVNTVISKQAVMKFHGVGNPSKTPAEATALEMGRGLLATVIGMLVATPHFTDLYRALPRIFRMSAEVINAVGHFVEILAAIFSQIIAFLYLGPALCLVAGTMSGAVRSVILQHFAKGGSLPPGASPDFGDISLKESNQDKAGKIVGLLVGVVLLFGFIGIGSGAKAETASLQSSLQWFLVLTVVHLLGNVQAVRQLEIKQISISAEVVEAPKKAHLLREMFLPKGYPKTVVNSYIYYRAWALLGVVVGYPKQIVTSMLFWGNVYGVGNAQSSPFTAVLTDIFMTTVDCVVGLLAGLPIISQSFNYSDPKWYYVAGTIARLAEFVQLAAVIAGSHYFYPLIVAARSLSAFAGTAGSRVNGAIPPALMRRDAAERKEIELIHVNVTGGNQEKATSLPSGVFSVAFLYYMVFTDWQPKLSEQVMMFCLLQVLSFTSMYGCYRNLPPLPGSQPEALLKADAPDGVYWEEQNDLDSELLNAFSGPASARPVLVRSSSRGEVKVEGELQS